MTTRSYSRNPSAWPIGLAALGVLLVAGCGVDMGASGQEPGDCRAAGCVAGQVCNANGVCVPEEGQALTIGLRILPPSDDVLEEHRIGLEIDGDTRLPDLVLQTPTRVSGTISAGEGNMPVPAEVTFRRLDGITGVRVSTDVTADVAGLYVVDLVPGRYGVTVRTSDTTTPPFRIEELTVSGTSLAYNIALGDPAAYLRVRGRLVRQRSGDVEVEEIAGAKVVLLSSARSVEVSTTVETAAETGEFSLTVRPITGTYLLRVEPSSTNQLVPSLTLGPITLEDADGTGSEPIDLGEVIAGEWADPVSVAGAVVGENGAPNPVGNATLFFERTLELGTFSLLTRAALDGRFGAQVIPGSYRVTVVPPADATYGATVFDTELAEATSDAAVPPLHHKPVLSGVVLGPDGAPVEGVRVQAEPTGYEVRSVQLVASDTATDEDGWWELEVHAGSQRLMFQPPAASGLAPRLAEIGTISSDTTLNVYLSHAGTLSSVLRASDGMPLAGATIEAYLTTDTGTTLRFTSVTTDDNGYFVVNLPETGL